MDSTYRALAVANELGEFTVQSLANRAEIKEATARTVLNRHRHLFERRSAESGRRGGQPQVWSVREDARTELAGLVGNIAARFDEDEGRLWPRNEGFPGPRSSARLRLSGPNPELLTAEDLENYADHPAARQLLPHIVRRLLVATSGVGAVAVRAGDAIGFTGYDGRAEASIKSPFVPEGRSVWEMGTSREPRAKAQADFRTRTRSPLDADPSTTTFVTVSMRRFRDKEDWEAKARQEGVWRDVRALDADDLAAWLEETPHVHIWASEQLGLRPLDVASLGRWWETWLNQTEPPTPAELLLAGRKHEARELRKALSPGSQVIGVYATSRQEAVAFVAASLLIYDDQDENLADRDSLSSTVVVVHTSPTWARLIESRQPAVLIPFFDDVDATGAIQRGHSVVIPLGSSDDRSRARIDLPLIGREEAREVIHRAMPKVALEVADQRAAHARRSLISFRRSFAVSPAQRNPAWAQKPSANVLAPLLLIGRWEGESESDRQIVSTLTGRPYEESERELRQPADPEDPPFIRAGSRWQLTAPTDAWTLLSHSLASAELDRWRTLAVEVLAEEDPIEGLKGEERLLASVRGLSRFYSSVLRSGIADSAALIAASDGRTAAPDGQPWSDHADDVVRQLLADAAHAERWASLQDVLPALAEASPDVFLSSVLQASRGQVPPLSAVFADSDLDIWESRSPHTGLLWALELLCWSEDYAAEACDALARLAEIDPGGRLANRPAASLRRVLLPWFPQTAASLDLRMQIVEGVLERRPAIGWDLLLGLLPQHFDSTHPNYRPTFRDWKAHTAETTVLERLEATRRLIELGLAHLARHNELWPKFVDVLPSLPPEDLQKCLSALAQVDLATVSSDLKLKVWQSLVAETKRHRQFSDAQWALPEDVLASFDTVATLWEPGERPERHARLFDWHPDLAGTNKFDHAAYDQRLWEERRRVVSPLLATEGLDAAVRLAREAPVPTLVGATVADVVGDTVRTEMLKNVAEEGPAGDLARGWTIRMSDIGGAEWISGILDEAASLPELKRSRLYLALPNTSLVWAAVDRETLSVSDQYWQRTAVFGVNPQDETKLVQKLVEHRRPWSALQLLAHHLHRPESDVSADLIERVLRASTGPDADEPLPAGSLDYYVGVLLDKLEKLEVTQQTLIEFELIFFALLQHHRSPRALFRALADSPKLFVDLVIAAFRATSEPASSEPTPAEAASARQAFMVLREWREPPGVDKYGALDEQLLSEWVQTARGLLADADRLSVGDECMGEVLSGSAPGVDGVWPAEPIRSLLEDIDSDSFAQGLAIGRFNACGVTSRGLFDGGKQEDALADQFDLWAKETMARWPRTGRMLREMAMSYRRQARRQDEASDEWASEN